VRDASSVAASVFVCVRLRFFPRGARDHANSNHTFKRSTTTHTTPHNQHNPTTQNHPTTPPKKTFESCKGLAEFLGKQVCTSQDRPGFLVNRVLIPMINEAFFCLLEVG
jgi:hypothetical protein